MINTIFFAPCGWYIQYHIGAWAFLKECGFLSDVKILGGSSSGSLTTYLLSSGLDTEYISEGLLSYANDYPGFKSWGNMSKLVNDIITNHLTNKTYDYENFVILSLFEKKWPFFIQKIVVPDKNNLEEIRSAILSSCYIPYICEQRPTWKDLLTIDGGLFMDKLKLPNALTITPYEVVSENVIGPEKDSEDYMLLKNYILGSLKIDRDHLVKVKNFGYTNAKNWFNKYQLGKIKNAK